VETLPRQVCGWGRDVLQWLASELLRAAERERADALHCFGAWSRRGPRPRAHAAPWLLRAESVRRGVSWLVEVCGLKRHIAAWS